MANLFSNILTASFHGSIVIVAVLILRLLLKKAPRKYICYLWLLAGLRLLMPFQIQSELSLQPSTPPQTAIRWEAPAPMELEAQANTPISQDSSAEAEGTVEKGGRRGSFYRDQHRGSERLGRCDPDPLAGNRGHVPSQQHGKLQDPSRKGSGGHAHPGRLGVG